MVKDIVKIKKMLYNYVDAKLNKYIIIKGKNYEKMVKRKLANNCTLVNI